MIHPDVFVAVVSIGAGLLLLGGSATQNARLMQATVPQFLTAQLGLTGSRIIIATAGVVFVVLGAWLLRPRPIDPDAKTGWGILSVAGMEGSYELLDYLATSRASNVTP